MKVVKGSVAQWLEQGIHKPKVVGSNPTRAICYSISEISASLKIIKFLEGEMAEWSKAIDC